MQQASSAEGSRGNNERKNDSKGKVTRKATKRKSGLTAEKAATGEAVGKTARETTERAK